PVSRPVRSAGSGQTSRWKTDRYENAEHVRLWFPPGWLVYAGVCRYGTPSFYQCVRMVRLEAVRWLVLAKLGSIPIPIALTRRNPCYCLDRKSTRLNSSHVKISYAVFCLKKKKKSQTK